MSEKATEYVVLVWYEPEDQEAWDKNGSLGIPDEEHNIDTLEEALKIYKQVGDVFTKELHHYYEVDTHGWESSSNVLLSWERREVNSDDFYEKYKPIYNHMEHPYYEEGQTEGDEIGYNMYFETYGGDLEYVKSVYRENPNLIWTLCDDGEVSYIGQGFRWVNRLNYLIASVPYKEGDKSSYVDRVWNIEEEFTLEEVEAMK
jgi:hypothetical protein|tara:strand:+ start:239 stop:844 length:606 start_codon:yes stop_codon:yes gene_type:complete